MIGPPMFIFPFPKSLLWLNCRVLLICSLSTFPNLQRGCGVYMCMEMQVQSMGVEVLNYGELSIKDEAHTYINKGTFV